jgi:hypothetical protein
MEHKEYKLDTTSGECDRPPETCTVLIDLELAKKILRLAGTIKRDGLLKASMFHGCEWVDGNGEDVSTDIDQLTVYESHVICEAALKHLDVRVSTCSLGIEQIAKDFGLDLAMDTPLPDGDYELVEGAAWLGIKGFSVRVQATDEGVVADIFARGDEMSESIAGTWAHDNDLLAEEQI